MAEQSSVITRLSELGYQFQDSSLSKEMADIAALHIINVAEAVKKFEIFAVQSDLQGLIKKVHLDNFKIFLSKEQFKGKENKQKQPTVGKSWHVNRSWEDEKLDLRTPKRQVLSSPSSLNLSTPPTITESTPIPATTIASDTKFSGRSNKGAIVASLNVHIEQDNSQVKRGQCVVELLSEPLNQQTRYMMDTIDSKVSAQDQRIERWAAAVTEALGAEAAECGSRNVAEATQEPTWVVGRIVSAEDGSSLNAASLMLEGSRRASAGARVDLDLSDIEEYRVFPGQVVAVWGCNPTGRKFIAKRLLSHLAPPPSTLASSLFETGGSLTSSGLSIIVAAGPFTSSEDLSFEPLRDLLTYCTTRTVDVLMLMGPLLDVDHPLLKTGLLNTTFSAVFNHTLLPILTSWLSQQAQQQQHFSLTATTSQAGKASEIRGPRVVLMPSVRDTEAAPVFPQPPFELSGLAPDQLLCLPNPCLARVAGAVTVASTTHDILKHLSGAEVARGSGDRLAALASHILGQRSFYPLYPPCLGACLDTTLDAHLQIPTAPDFLLLPSDIAPFAKIIQIPSPTAANNNIEQSSSNAAAVPALSPSVAVPLANASGSTPVSNPSTHMSGEGPGSTVQLSHQKPKSMAGIIAVNPGRLAKGPSGGTFAHVYVSAGEGCISSRSKVEIKRI